MTGETDMYLLQINVYTYIRNMAGNATLIH